MVIAIVVVCCALLHAQARVLLHDTVEDSGSKLILWSGKSGALEDDVLFYSEQMPRLKKAAEWQDYDIEYLSSAVRLPIFFYDRKIWPKLISKVYCYHTQNEHGLVGWPERHLYFLYEERGW